MAEPTENKALLEESIPQTLPEGYKYYIVVADQNTTQQTCIDGSPFEEASTRDELVDKIRGIEKQLAEDDVDSEYYTIKVIFGREINFSSETVSKFKFEVKGIPGSIDVVIP